LLCAFSLSPS